MQYVSTTCAPTVVLCACGCMFVEVKMKCTGCALQPYMVLALDPVLFTPKIVEIVLPICELVFSSGQLANDQSPHFQAGPEKDLTTGEPSTTSRVLRKRRTNKSCPF